MSVRCASRVYRITPGREWSDSGSVRPARMRSEPCGWPKAAWSSRAVGHVKTSGACARHRQSGSPALRFPAPDSRHARSRRLCRDDAWTPWPQDGCGRPSVQMARLSDGRGHLLKPYQWKAAGATTPAKIQRTREALEDNPPNYITQLPGGTPRLCR